MDWKRRGAPTQHSPSQRRRRQKKPSRSAARRRRRRKARGSKPHRAAPARRASRPQKQKRDQTPARQIRRPAAPERHRRGAPAALDRDPAFVFTRGGAADAAAAPQWAGPAGAEARGAAKQPERRAKGGAEAGATGGTATRCSPERGSVGRGRADPRPLPLWVACRGAAAGASSSAHVQRPWRHSTPFVCRELTSRHPTQESGAAVLGR